VAQLSRDEFDAIEFGAARTGDHRGAAILMSQLAATGSQTSEMSRAEAHLRAGEQWLLADDPQTAADGFRLALAEGGRGFDDARVSLARALFLLGRPEEARSLISQLEADQPPEPRLCDLVAELLVEQSDLAGALTWATRGVELCLPQDARSPNGHTTGARVPRQVPPTVDGTELRMLLSLRYRIRNDLGLPEDEFDRLLDEF
jgi:hypothetical protein